MSFDMTRNLAFMFRTTDGGTVIAAQKESFSTGLETEYWSRIGREAWGDNNVRGDIKVDIKVDNKVVQVMLFSDRLEIWNPGSLPRGWTVDMLFKPHTSLPPNELIAGPMYLKGYIEKMGTGTEDVAKLCAKSGLPAPGFTEGVDFRAVLMRKKDGALSNEIHVGTQVKTQVKTQVETQVKAQVISLARVMKGEMTTSEMMRLVGIRQRKNFHSHYISEALKSGIVEMTQPDSPRSPTQKYRLTAKGRKLLSHASQSKAAEATAEVSEET